MRRTRKWAYVQQEAERLYALKLKPKEIAARLGVAHSTVTRWINAGKFGQKPPDKAEQQRVITAEQRQTPAQWAAAVRAAFDLDATDEQLVGMGESSLLVARDPATPAQLRLQAMGRFQAIVKQLALVARAADAKTEPGEPARKTFEPPKRTGTDPRGILAEVG